ncbi:MAG: ABC transporter ATP-binding protein [Ignavibacteriaceae bacterium]|nr:ABC transporter ATP-binding protein [Ignavibacteriaceae bacterium]
MIEVVNIYKSYKKIKALTGVSHNFQSGIISTIAGPNGSGKTTLIKCILGFLFPESGEILFKGKSIKRETEYKKFFGYMSQNASFPENLKVIEILDFLKGLRKDVTNYDEELIEQLNYGREFDKKFGSLSGGNRQKLNAVIAFLFNPEVVILDEPTAGLDPGSASILIEKIFNSKRQGKSIIITTHIKDEIDKLSDELLIMNEGKIEKLISKEELQENGIYNLLGNIYKINVKRA